MDSRIQEEKLKGMTKTNRIEKESEEYSKVLEPGRLLALRKKYKYIWIFAYIGALVVLFAYIKLTVNPGIVAFLFFVAVFGLVVIYAYRKIGMSYQEERKIITRGNEDPHPFV